MFLKKIKLWSIAKNNVETCTLACQGSQGCDRNHISPVWLRPSCFEICCSCPQCKGFDLLSMLVQYSPVWLIVCTCESMLCGLRDLSHTVLETSPKLCGSMVEVSHTLCLSYRNGKNMQIPEALITEDSPDTMLCCLL